MEPPVRCRGFYVCEALLPSALCTPRRARDDPRGGGLRSKGVKLRDLGVSVLTAPPLEDHPKGCRGLPWSVLNGEASQPKNWVVTLGTRPGKWCVAAAGRRRARF